MVSRELIATVLVENTPAEGLGSEHGLSMHLRYGGLNILLDFGQSDLFAQTAEVLGCDLSRVEFAVLSHAHYDHADGMPAFFARNERARLYLGEACQENCWSTKGGTAEAHYIGIGEGLLRRYNDRLARVPTAGVSTIASGVHLVPHSTPSLAEQGLHTRTRRRTRARIADHERTVGLWELLAEQRRRPRKNVLADFTGPRVRCAGQRLFDQFAFHRFTLNSSFRFLARFYISRRGAEPAEIQEVMPYFSFPSYLGDFSAFSASLRLL